MQATLCTPRSIDASAHCMLALNNQGRILLNKNTPAPKKIESPDLFQPLFAGAATVSAGHAHWGAVMDTGEVCLCDKSLTAVVSEILTNYLPSFQNQGIKISQI